MTIKRTVTPDDIRALTTTERRGYNAFFTREATTIVNEHVDLFDSRDYIKAVDGRLLQMASLEDMIDQLAGTGRGVVIRLDLDDPFESLWTAFKEILDQGGRGR